MTGQAGGLNVSTLMTATTGNTGTPNYVGEIEVTAAQAPDTVGGAALFGGNDNVQLRNGATGWLQLVGREIDVNAQTGSSTQDIIGQQIVEQNNATVIGSRSNIGFTLNNGNSNATGWDCGFCFGAYAGKPPLTAVSTMIGCWPNVTARSGSGGAVPTTNCGTTLYGVDLSNVTFASGGSPFLAPLMTPATSGATCRTGAIEWDASFIYICTATNTWRRATLASF